MAERLPRATAAEVLRVLNRDGWAVTRQSGSHAVLHHPTKLGRVTVPRHAGKTLRLKTMESILEQAGLTPADYARLR